MSDAFDMADILPPAINAEPAIALLAKGAAKAVNASIKASSLIELVHAKNDVRRHAKALRELGVALSDVVESICYQVDQTSFDIDAPPVIPDFDLKKYVQGMLTDAEFSKQADRDSRALRNLRAPVTNIDELEKILHDDDPF